MAVGNFLSVTEAAAVIGCTDARVRQLCESRDLEAEKFNGRAWAVLASSAKNYAKTQQKRGRPRGSKNLSKSA
jgi:hypothetical protein